MIDLYHPSTYAKISGASLVKYYFQTNVFPLPEIGKSLRNAFPNSISEIRNVVSFGVQISQTTVVGRRAMARNGRLKKTKR